MAVDSMVAALQGQRDPTMDALFSRPPPTATVPFLQRWQLEEKGREMLKDPNRPQYDPNNVGAPVGPERPIIDPRHYLQHMAGDVIPFPISPQVADQRRMRNEDFMADVHARFGQPGIDVHNRMWPPVRPIPLRPENE